ncbi:MAG: hypothetical protein ACTSPY_11210 [Candidatus Helarchaeota archaeon]
MTHSLHRIGEIDELKNDYVILTMLARGINDKFPDSRNKLLRAGEIFQENNPSSIMDRKLWNISPVVTASFDNIGSVNNVISTIKENNLGLSVVVSGLISEIKKISTEIGLKPHTIHMSLGIFGKKELLPNKNILEATTMCGHHCISPQSITYYINQINIGNITIEEASEKLASCCVCGIFNRSRAVYILNKIIEQNSI